MAEISSENSLASEQAVSEVSQWVEEHGDALFRFARSRVNSHELAEDLVQTTYISALKDYQRFRRESSAKTWLVSILRHKIMDHYRKKKPESLENFPDSGESLHQSQEKTAEMIQDIASIRLNPEEILEHGDLRKTLSKCMDGLPNRLRMVFMLRDIEDETTEKICEELDISISNFSVMMHRARKQLHECFMKHGFNDLFSKNG